MESINDFIFVPAHQQGYVTIVLICTALNISKVLYLSFIYISPTSANFFPLYESQAILTVPYSEVPRDRTLVLVIFYRYTTRTFWIIDRLFYFMLAYHPLLPSLHKKITKFLRTRTSSHASLYPDHDAKGHFNISKYFWVLSDVNLTNWDQSYGVSICL